MEITVEQGIKKIQERSSITFLTGAGVSTPSGVPDYRSLQGVYHGLEAPEYLLSTECLKREPEKFYSFVKHLYHEEARPNSIHRAMAELEKTKKVWVVSQNIDGLHQAAQSRHLINFHGSLYDCYCQKCGNHISWKDYLKSDRHEHCGGQVRPNIVLYGEGFSEQVLTQAVEAVQQAELIVICGTSFQVHPFCDLVYEASKDTEILVINQTPIFMDRPYEFIQANGTEVFDKI